MYNKSGSRNKQNKAIEKTTTEKKDKKTERRSSKRNLQHSCNAFYFLFWLQLFAIDGRLLTHTHTILRTHTFTSLDSHTHTHTRPQRANALHITAKRAINSKNGGNNVQCAAHNLQHAAHALCVASTAAIP